MERTWIKRRRRWRKNAREKSKLIGKVINLAWRIPADTLWGKIIKWLAPFGRCEITACARPAHEAHHIIKRDNLFTRYKTRNGIGLCVLHHRLDNDFSAHLTKDKFMAWLEEHKPDQFQWVQENKFKISFERFDYKEQYDILLKEWQDGEGQTEKEERADRCAGVR